MPLGMAEGSYLPSDSPNRVLCYRRLEYVSLLAPLRRAKPPYARRPRGGWNMQRTQGSPRAAIERVNAMPECSPSREPPLRGRPQVRQACQAICRPSIAHTRHIAWQACRSAGALGWRLSAWAALGLALAWVWLLSGCLGCAA